MYINPQGYNIVMMCDSTNWHLLQLTSIANQPPFLKCCSLTLPMQVVVGLLDLATQYTPAHPAVGRRPSSPSTSPDPKKGSLSSSKSTKFASDVAKKALNLMVLLRPVTMVTTLAKEVATYLASQHVTHFPHSSLQPVPVSGRSCGCGLSLWLPIVCLRLV